MKKIALVTGSNRGIGKAVVKELLKQGMTVILTSRDQADGIIVNSVCPGWVRTDMGGMSAPRSVEKRAETILWTALLPDNSPAGKFFRDKKEISF